LREFLHILGVFRNDTGRIVDIRASRRGGVDYVHVLHVAPATIAGFAVEKGTVTATSVAGKTLAEGKIMPARLIDPYYDRQKKAYYYRITHSSIEPVLPQDAQGWGRGYTGGRD